MRELRSDKLAFALAYIITYSAFMTAFGPLHQQLRTQAPLLVAVMSITYVVCAVILLIETFGLFGKIGGGSDAGIGGSVGGKSSSSFTGGSGPGTKAGDGGPLRVNILGPKDGSFAPLGGKGTLAFEIGGGAKPVIWDVQPATYVGRSQGQTGWGNVVKVPLSAPMPGKQTITVTVRDGQGKTASATAGYTVVAGGTISGRVMDKGNNPLGGVAVYLGAPGNTSVLRGYTGKVELTAKTKDDGSFKFEDVPFGQAVQIRATTSTHEGIVKVPQTGWEKSTFSMGLDMPVIENCVVIFPDYEYKKPSIKIKKIDGIAIASKDYNTAVSAKKALDVEIEVGSGNAVGLKKKDDLDEIAKKLELLCIYTTSEGVQYQVPFGIKKDGEKPAIKIDGDKWTYTCELTYGERLPLLPYGEYRVYVTVKDDHKGTIKEEARFMVMQGMGFGGASKNPFRIAIESVNGITIPPNIDSVPTEIPGGDKGIIRATIEGGVPKIEGYCIVTLRATVTEYHRVTKFITNNREIKEYTDWDEGKSTRYTYGKITTPKVQAVLDGNNQLLHILEISADFKTLRSRVPRSKESDEKREIVSGVELLIQTIVEDSSNPRQQTGNACLVFPDDFGMRGGRDEREGNDTIPPAEIIVTIIDRSNATFGGDNKREAPFDMVLDVLDENGAPAKNLDDGIMIAPLQKGQSTDDIRFPNAAPRGSGRKLRVKLSKREGSTLGAILAAIDIVMPTDMNKSNVQIVFTWTGKNMSVKVS